jgi:hypothetical protein
VLLFAWCLQLVTLVITLAWLMCDGYAHRLAAELGIASFDSFAYERLPRELAKFRLVALGVLGALTAGCSITIVVGYWMGAAAHRSIRALMAMTLLTAAWSAIAISWQHLVDFGRVERLQWNLPAVVEFADAVDRNWNHTNNDRCDEPWANLAPHNAYPIDYPAMIMFFGEQPIPGTPITLSAIERTENEAIRFELSGSNQGFWLERRFDGSAPKAFVGGLGERRTPHRVQKLDSEVFLVQYSSD